VNYINSKTAGAKMPRASMDVLRNFDLILPPFETQVLFANFVDKVEKLKERILFNGNFNEELLNKKMDEYFGGDTNA
jgi:restriction endonuclease S subunit